MKLYELSRGDYFKLAGDVTSPVFEFEKVDGMYSLCWDVDHNVHHFSASTPVVRVADGNTIRSSASVLQP